MDRVKGIRRFPASNGGNGALWFSPFMFKRTHPKDFVGNTPREEPLLAGFDFPSTGSLVLFLTPGRLYTEPVDFACGGARFSFSDFSREWLDSRSFNDSLPEKLFVFFLSTQRP